MRAPHGNWKRLGPSDRGKFCCCWQSRDGKQTCVEVATHACNVHDFNGRWCGGAMCAKHVPRPPKPRLGGKKLRRQGKQRGVCFSGFGCVRGLGVGMTVKRVSRRLIRLALRKLTAKHNLSENETCEPCGECPWCAARFEAVALLREALNGASQKKGAAS